MVNSSELVSRPDHQILTTLQGGKQCNELQRNGSMGHWRYHASAHKPELNMKTLGIFSCELSHGDDAVGSASPVVRGGINPNSGDSPRA